MKLEGWSGAALAVAMAKIAPVDKAIGVGGASRRRPPTRPYVLPELPTRLADAADTPNFRSRPEMDCRVCIGGADSSAASAASTHPGESVHRETPPRGNR
jgi:hypothetical protein